MQQKKSILSLLKEETGIKIESLAVDGGASVNDYLMQFQSNILNLKLIRPACLETTALGVAYLAGLAVKVWVNKEEVLKYHTVDKIFLSKINSEERERLYKGWKTAIKATREFKV